MSVIVPAYNAASTIEPTLRSLLQQTNSDIEIVVVDDASIDNTKQIISKLASEHENIVPIFLSDNIGVHEARLVGLKQAKADWIGFLDADDFARPDMFAKLYSAAIKHKVDIVTCGSYRVTSERKVLSAKIKFKHNEIIHNDVFSRFCKLEFGTGTLWNKLYKKSIMPELSDMHFSWRQNINEDLLLNLLFFYNANSIYLMKDMLHDYVLNIESATAQIDNTEAYVQMLRAYAIAISFFSHKGQLAVDLIIDLYRTQLSWPPYQIKDIRTLKGYDAKIKDAALLILNHSPSALVALAPSTTRPTQSAFITAMKKFYVNFIK